MQAAFPEAEIINMQSAQYVVRTPGGDGGVVTRRFGTETLLVPVCGGVGDLDSVYTLNELGTTIWDAIAEPVSVSQLVATIADTYDVAPEQARADVDAFLEELTQLGLVRMVESPQEVR